MNVFDYIFGNIQYSKVAIKQMDKRINSLTLTTFIHAASIVVICAMYNAQEKKIESLTKELEGLLTV